MTDGNPPHRDITVADGGSDLADISAVETGETERTESVISNGERSEAASNAKQEFLLETIRRAPLLKKLQSGAADVSTLSKSVDMSRSTVHRATNSLEDSDIIKQANGKYQLTSFGKLLAEEMGKFDTRACAGMALKQFLNAIDEYEHGIPIEYFTDADIIRRKPRQPHATIHRIIRLFEASDEIRMFSTVISPVYVDVGYREMMDGMEIEAIFDKEVIDLMLSEYPEKAHEAISTGNFDVYAHDGLPFEMFLCDDKIGLAAHNENGNAEMLVECTNPLAIEWAESLYSDHLSNADPLMLSDS